MNLLHFGIFFFFAHINTLSIDEYQKQLKEEQTARIYTLVSSKSNHRMTPLWDDYGLVSIFLLF